MNKFGFQPDTLIDLFANATAKQTDQLRDAVRQATLGALQGRELTLKNIRGTIQSVTQAAQMGAAKNAIPGVDVEAMLDTAIAGMDDALLRAVEANRVALAQFAAQGADMREKHLKKALGDLEKFEDAFISTVRKSAGAVNNPFASQWDQVLEKWNLSGTRTGSQASGIAEQMAEQMQTAMRDSRAAGFKAAQTLAESYTALVSGVLIGMSDALQGSSSRKKK